MTDADDLERRLAEAFDADARRRVPDDRVPPPLRLPSHRAPRDRHRRWLAPVAAAAAVVVVAAAGVELGRGSGGQRRHGALETPRVLSSSSGQVGAASTSAPASSATPKSQAAPASGSASHTGRPALPVKVTSAVLGDGSRVGVGMPIIVLLSRPIKDARAFATATQVTVNGKAVAGGWYFEHRYQDSGHPIEADYRLPTYWPGHAQVHLSLPVQGRSAGAGLVFANSLSLDFATGAANVLTVDNATHKMTVVSDGKVWGTFPVSLGYPNTPTKRGVKVIMEKGLDISMRGPGYYDPSVKFTQRLTYGGEYLHSAPWNLSNIARGVNSSNGCTNLTPPIAKRLYSFTEIGDVVKFPNADGPLMALGDGYGDWNVPWPQWKTGGLYPVG